MYIVTSLPLSLNKWRNSLHLYPTLWWSKSLPFMLFIFSAIFICWNLSLTFYFLCSSSSFYFSLLISLSSFLVGYLTLLISCLHVSMLFLRISLFIFYVSSSHEYALFLYIWDLQLICLSFTNVTVLCVLHRFWFLKICISWLFPLYIGCGFYLTVLTLCLYVYLSFIRLTVMCLDGRLYIIPVWSSLFFFPCCELLSLGWYKQT